MGVAGLWDLLRPAATRASLSSLSKEAFVSNRHGLRAFTVGIDASIWIFHAQAPQAGENPFLRTIFFKIAALLQHPVLPVFVFDGPNKPSRKRNQTVAGHFGTSDFQSKQFKQLLDICGLEWWIAPGEAEAELALMNRQGKIDAVLSDDADALLFGATCLLRNNSPTLSGSKASSTQTNSTKSDGRTYEVYRSSAIKDRWIEDREGSALATEEDCRLAMVLVALLGGGDYVPEGVQTFGPTIASGLAHAGCADFLKHYTSDPEAFADSLPQVKEQIIDELRTNASGFIGRRYKTRADDLISLDPSQIFPDVALKAYLTPATSGDDTLKGWPGFGKGDRTLRRGLARNLGRGDLEGMARACEKFFEWGTKELVCKKFAGESSLYKAAILDHAWDAARAKSRPVHTSSSKARDQSPPPRDGRLTSFFNVAKPSSSSRDVQPDHTGVPPYVTRIYSTRADPSTSGLTELRVGFSPAHFDQRCRSSMNGDRVDPKDLDTDERERLGLVDKDVDADTENTPSTTAKDEVRIWIPEYLVREVWPHLIEVYETEKAEKERLKSPRKPKKTASAPPSKAGTGGHATLLSMGFVQRLPSRVAPPLDDFEEEVNRAASDSELSLSIGVQVVVTSPGGGGKETSVDKPRRARLRSDLSSSSGSTAGSSGLAMHASTSSPSSSPIRRPKPSKTKRQTVIESPPNSPPVQRPTGLAPRGPFSRVRSAPEAFPSTDFLSTASAGRAVRQMSVASSSGSKDEPIDLCSDSDDEVVSAPQRVQSSPSRRPKSTSNAGNTARNTSSPSKKRSTSQSKPPPPAPTTTGQTRLDTIFVQRRPGPSIQANRDPVVKPPRKPFFVVTSSTDDVECIDLRRVRR